MRYNNVLKLRLPDSLRHRLDDAARRSERTVSEIVRDALARGLDGLSRSRQRAKPFRPSGLPGTADAPPPGIEPEIWKFLKPEERSLWRN